MFFRLAFESLLNTVLAFLWPLYVLQWLSNWGIVVLLVGWWSYGKWAAPYFATLGVKRRERSRKKDEQISGS